LLAANVVTRQRFSCASSAQALLSKITADGKHSRPFLEFIDVTGLVETDSSGSLRASCVSIFELIAQEIKTSSHTSNWQWVNLTFNMRAFQSSASFFASCIKKKQF